jgi:hypothetical protein
MEKICCCVVDGGRENLHNPIKMRKQKAARDAREFCVEETKEIKF